MFFHTTLTYQAGALAVDSLSTFPVKLLIYTTYIRCGDSTFGDCDYTALADMEVLQ
jgi:hypothetical protein